MATIAVAAASVDGVALSMVAAAGGGDAFPNDGETLFVVTNGGGGSINVTVAPVGKTPQGYTIKDVVVAVAAGATKYLGPFDQSIFNDSTGKVAVTYSGVTTVTVGAIGAIAP